MSQFQDLARCLLAAGYTMHPEGKGIYLLYTNRSSLISKHWSGTSFGEEDLITTSVQPASSAFYLFAPAGRVVVCVYDATLHAIRYDEEEEDWVDDENFPHQDVYPDGKFAACIDADGSICAFFQNPSGRLIYLDSSGTLTDLPAHPIAGSPISATVDGDEMHVFYVSVEDNCIHYVSQEDDGEWTDKIVAGFRFDEKPIQFISALNEENGAFEVYVLTRNKAVQQITSGGGGGRKELGKIDGTGKFVPGTTAEFCPFLWGLSVSVRVNVNVNINRYEHEPTDRRAPRGKRGRRGKNN